MPFIKRLTTFQDKIKKMTARQFQQAGKDSVEWFKGKVVNTFSDVNRAVEHRWVTKRMIGADKTTKRAITMHRVPRIGHLYFMLYDPKWKKTLPFYDTFPVVIPIDYTKGGFYGMNFHYLPYNYRAHLLDSLMSLKAVTIDTTRSDRATQEYVRISYEIMKSAARYYKPTFKKYLYGHVRSQFANVDFDEWGNAIFLPVESFKKAGKREVWADSRSKL